MSGSEENTVNPASQVTRPLNPSWDTVLAFLSRVKIRRKLNALRLAETLPLGDRRMLAIVEWRGETLLLGVTPQQITLLEKSPLSPDGSARNEEPPR